MFRACLASLRVVSIQSSSCGRSDLFQRLEGLLATTRKSSNSSSMLHQIHPLGGASLLQRRSSACSISSSWPRHHQAARSTHSSHLLAARQRGRWQVITEASGGSGSGSGGSGSGAGKGYSSSGGGGSGGGGSGDDGLWAAYNRLLASNPIFVKAVTTAVLSAIGNLICQFVIEKQEQLDWRRFNTFTALGFVWVAPCLHFWFGALNRLVTTPGNAGALLRMACDQLGFAPLFISSMIAILTILDGKADKAVDTVRADLPSAIKANWALWVPAQFLNFRFVPGEYQVLFANVVALAWNVYFSYATRPKKAAA